MLELQEQRITSSPAEAVETAGLRLLNIGLKRALRVAWLAILLGVIVQMLVVIGRHSAGAAWPNVSVFAELAQSVSWSLLVCTGLAVGSAAGRHRTSIMGWVGLISAPIAWGVAKGVERAVENLLHLPVEKLSPFLYVMCSVKGVEFALLGAALGYLSQIRVIRFRHFALFGLAVGALAAVVVVTLSYRHGLVGGNPLKPPQVMGLAVSELLFPMGCAMVFAVAARFRELARLF